MGNTAIGMPREDSPVVDGFLYSASMLYLSTTYRASVLAQMEILRRAKGYRTRWYVVPDNDTNSTTPPNTGSMAIPAYGQVELQINTVAGAYLWGLSFVAYTLVRDTLTAADLGVFDAHVQITDACTETPVFSDYASVLQVRAEPPNSTFGFNRRNPFLLSQPRLIGEPGLLDAEIYNNTANDLYCQLVVLMAEPCLPPEEMRRLMEQAGLLSKYNLRG